MDNQELFHAWAAGFFDGEGSLSIYILRRRSESLCIRTVAQVSQQSREPLELLKNAYGGYINDISNGRVKAFYKWSLVGRAKMEYFLKAIQPFSVVKRCQILTIFQCIEIQKPRGARGGKLSKHKAIPFYTGEELGRFIALRQQIQQLNANS